MRRHWGWVGGVWLGMVLGRAAVPTGPEGVRLPEPPLLPGSREFHFSMYSCPGEVGQLDSLVRFLKEHSLASAFDPAAAATASARPVLEYLARLGWPVILYPPEGGRMQVQGGTSVLGRDDEEAVRVLDRAGVFSAIQLGEWGYHFHRLRSDAGWWKAVLGEDYAAQRDRFLLPPDSRGYQPRPVTRRECYDQLRDYFL
ncbi:MAG: hypothetical protein ACKO3N_02970, partial [Verrucomicrobiota bacterium]